MIPVSHYWTFVRLDATGRRQRHTYPDVQAFFLAMVPDASDAIDHGAIQRQLVARMQSCDRALAEFCLRCLISQQIEQVCQQLANQFGEYYGFTDRDLLRYVLDDDGRAQFNGYQPLSLQILSRFDPQRANLTTWVTRLVKQHRELNQFLLQQGLCMLSDWAILNDTNEKKLRRILTQFHHLSVAEVNQASQLLQAYHAVYRRDRILQGQTGPCPEPTPAQLDEISQLLEHPDLPPLTLLARLHRLADQLRQHRIAMRGGTPRLRSLDEPATAADLDRLTSREPEADDPQTEFLQTYRQQFRACLGQAIETVVQRHLQQRKPPKDRAFLTAMQLFYCQGLAMGAIAPHVGLTAQFQVCRLMQLKAFRADVRHELIQRLLRTVEESARSYAAPAQLAQLDDQIAYALGEQIDRLMQDDEAHTKTPKSYASGSVFARHVCQCLDRRFADRLS